MNGKMKEILPYSVRSPVYQNRQKSEKVRLQIF